MSDETTIVSTEATPEEEQKVNPMEEALKVIAKDRNARILACRKEIEAVLAKYNCKIQLSSPRADIVSKV